MRDPLLCRAHAFETGFALTTDGAERVLLEADGVRSIDIGGAVERFQAGIFPGGELSLDGQAVIDAETGNLVWRDIAGEMEIRIALADESVGAV
ncbi:MAG: hypothetical protein AAGE01_12780 [Pseudomonadota bacterium]